MTATVCELKWLWQPDLLSDTRNSLHLVYRLCVAHSHVILSQVIIIGIVCLQLFPTQEISKFWIENLSVHRDGPI